MCHDWPEKGIRINYVQIVYNKTCDGFMFLWDHLSDVKACKCPVCADELLWTEESLKILVKMIKLDII